MKAVSDEEKKLYEQSNIRDLTLEFGNGVTITNDNIASESMTFEEMICENNSLTFGSCNASAFNVEVRDTEHSFKGESLNVTLTSGSYARKIGSFTVVSDNKTDDKLRRKIVAYDAIYGVKDIDVSEWYLGLTFPMTLKTFRDSFFEHIGITQEDVSLVNDNMSVEKTINPTTLTALTVMESICELNACFGHMNSEGNFEYVNLRDRLDTIYPSNDLYPSETLIPMKNVTPIDIKLSSLKYEDFTCKPITEVKIRQEENDVGCTVGKTGNTYAIQANFLVYGKGTDELSVIANNFMSSATYIEYTPASATMRGKPWFELGDFVTVTALNGDTVVFPILHRTLSGIIGLMDDIEAPGEETFTEKQTLSDKIEQVQGKSNIVERTLEETKSEIKETYATKTEAKDYAGTAESNAKGYADNVGSDTLNNAKADATDKANSALNNAKGYTDDKLKDYSTTKEVGSAIDQKADEINANVKEVSDTVNSWISLYPADDLYPADELYCKDGSASSSEVNSYVDIKIGEVVEGVEKSTQEYVENTLYDYSKTEEVKSLIEISENGFKQTLDSTTDEWKKYADDIGDSANSYADDVASTAEKNAKDYTSTTLNSYYTKQEVNNTISNTKDDIMLDYNTKIEHLGTLHPSDSLFPSDDTYPEDGYAMTSATEAMIKLSEEGIEQKVSSQIEKEREDIDESYSEFVQQSKLMQLLVASGENESDIILTDKFMALISEEINLSGKVTFSTFDDALKDKLAKQSVDNIYTEGTTTIDGGKITANSITADKITVGADSNIVTINSDTAESLKVPLCTLSKNTLVENSIITKTTDKYLTICNYRPWDLSHGDEVYFKASLCGAGDTAHVEVVTFNASKQKIGSFNSGNFTLPVDSYETIQESISIGYAAQTISYYVVAIVRNTTGNSIEIMDGAICKTKADGELIVNGSITAEQLATDAIKSRNYVQGSIGSFMNMADGSYDSLNLKWDKYGQLTTNSATIINAKITNATIKGGSLDIETDDKSYDQILLKWLNTDQTIEAMTQINPGSIKVYGNGALDTCIEVSGTRIVASDGSSETNLSPTGMSVGQTSVIEDGVYTNGIVMASSGFAISNNRTGWSGDFYVRQNGKDIFHCYVDGGMIYNVTF